MAESNRDRVPLNVQAVMDEINTGSSDIPDDQQRNELRQDLQDLVDIDTSQLATVDTMAITSQDSKAVKTMKTLMKFTGQGLLELGKLASGPGKLVLSAIAAVVIQVFSSDIVAEVTEKFKAVLDERFMVQCHATSNKFRNCARYINGLPRPDGLSQEERRLYIGRLASDNPINTGLEEMSILCVDIQMLIDSRESPDMTLLMNKVQMYCCLTTFRELFLLARFTIESSYGIDTQSIVEVLEGQRNDDRRLLRFLNKPNINTLHIFLKYKPNEWPIADEFLRRRRLVTNVQNLQNNVYQIQSVAYPEKLLSVHDLVILTCLRCSSGTEGDHTLFQVRVRQGGVITLHPFTRQHYYIYSRDWVRMGSDPAQGSREWQLVEIEPETPTEQSYFVFRMGSQENYCMFADDTGRVYVRAHVKGDQKCFWRLSLQD